MRASVSDRAGLGWSDLSPKRRTAENIVDELHTLLTRETYQALAAADTKFLEAVIAEQKAFDPNLAQVRAARITTLGSPRPMCLFRRIKALRYGEQG
jgi:hypothetical protein